MTLQQLNEVAYIRYVTLNNKRLEIKTERINSVLQDYFELNGEKVYEYDWYIYDVDKVYADLDYAEPYLVVMIE